MSACMWLPKHLNIPLGPSSTSTFLRMDTGLDTANQLDENLQTVYRGGRPVPIAAGSIAVMRIIQEYQPMLALHGHIHESRGKAIIGRTVALNAGSDYASGRLMGVVVRLSSEKVLSHQFVTG